MRCCFLGITDHPVIELKVGINSGRVIAGVVGAKYPRYRLMGDTVNTCEAALSCVELGWLLSRVVCVPLCLHAASRMSTSCGPRDIQLSSTAFAELGENSGFHCKYRGEIPVKGKGMMKTYLLQSYTPPVDTSLPHQTLADIKAAAASEAGGAGAGGAGGESKKAAPAVEAESLEAQISDLTKLVKKEEPAAAPLESKDGALVASETKSADSAGSPTSAGNGTAGAGAGAGSAGGSPTSAAAAGLASTSPSHHPHSLSVAPAPASSEVRTISLEKTSQNALFNIPKLSDIMYPRTWQKLLSLRFVRHRELESRFQAEYLSRFSVPNRGALSQVLVALLFIATYDTLANSSVAHDSMVASWILRACALALGLAWYASYFTSVFKAKKINAATMDFINCIVSSPSASLFGRASWAHLVVLSFVCCCCVRADPDFDRRVHHHC